MALSKLSGDEKRTIFVQLCDVFDPGVAVAFSSTSSELRELTTAERQQLQADHEAAAALAHNAGKGSCKRLREARDIGTHAGGLSSDDLATLGMLGSVLPALEKFYMSDGFSGVRPDGVQRLAEKLRAGALPAVTFVRLGYMSDADASALALALDRGALQQLKKLQLGYAAVGDAALVALAPALRRLPALEVIDLERNPLADTGLAALVAPPQPAGVPPPMTGGLTKLKSLSLVRTQITDAGCATLAAALDSGALPALGDLLLSGIPASAAAKATVRRAGSRAGFCVRG